MSRSMTSSVQSLKAWLMRSAFLGFFDHAVWPAVVAGFVSLVVSIGTQLLLFRAISQGIANITLGELLQLLLSR